jgi:serine/threonine protein kinase
MIAFLCSGCGKSLKVKDEFAGRKGRCPHCQQPMTVPTLTDARERAEQAGHDDYVESDAKTVLPPDLDTERDSKTILPAVPRGSSARNKGNTAIPDAAAASDAKVYDFLSPAQSADEIGRLGTYRVLKVLGVGGMGIVFQAEDPKLKRLVALKAMLPTLAASGSNKERFIREARAAAAVEHDHIIPIFEVNEDRGVPFIAMPFLRGESLEDRLKRERKLPLDEALRIAKEIADGLAAAHERHMIHRDIKPANIWLEGERGRVRILDFGLARSARSESDLTQKGMIIGTPAYMAPEQGAGKPVDPRCDLFSLGCVLYRMTTGTLPFKGTDTVSTLVAVATQMPKAPRKLNPAISPRLSRLIMELLAKDPKDRPPSARSVVDLIEELEKEPPQDATEIVDEPVPLVQAVRAADDFDRDTVRCRPLDDEEWEEGPPKRSLMLPLLIGGFVGLLALLVIGVVGLVLFLKSSETPDVAQNNNSPAENTITNPPPVQQDSKPKPNPIVPPRQGKKPKPAGHDGGVPAPLKGKGDERPSVTQPKPRPKKKEVHEADKTYKPYNSPVKGLLFAPDGKHFFSFAERNSRVDYWDLESGKIVRSFELGGNVHHFLISPDGSRLIAFNSGRLLCWDVEGGQSLVTVTPPLGATIVGGGFTANKEVRAALCAKLPAGSNIAIYDHGLGKLIPLVNPKTNKPVINPRTKKPEPLSFPHAGTEVELVLFSPDSKRFISWSRDRMFRTWDVEQARLVTTSAVAPGANKALAVSPDFKHVMGAFGQPEFRIYDVEAGTEVKEIKPDGVGSTDALAYGSQSTIGVAARFGGNTRIYDLEDGTVQKEVKGVAFTRAIALAPDSKMILCGDISGKIHVFKLDE